MLYLMYISLSVEYLSLYQSNLFNFFLTTHSSISIIHELLLSFLLFFFLLLEFLLLLAFTLNILSYKQSYRFNLLPFLYFLSLLLFLPDFTISKSYFFSIFHLINIYLLYTFFQDHLYNNILQHFFLHETFLFFLLPTFYLYEFNT